MEKPKILRGLSADHIWDYENGFYWFSKRTRINKLLAHYELYKSIIHLPGHIFELGVYKCTSLIRFASFRDSLENDYSRKIVAFDAFGRFPVENVNESDDLDFIQKFEESGGRGLELEEAQEILLRKGFENITLIKGNIVNTLPKYLKDNPETKISMIHLDMDVKEPSSFALDLLYDRLVTGGIIVVDDYNAVRGATEAVDRFIETKKLKLEKLPFYHVPSFIRKPEIQT